MVPFSTANYFLSHFILNMQVEKISQSYIPKKETSFKAKICYVDNKTFQALLKQLPDCFEVGRITNKDWLIDEAAVKKKKAHTLGTYNCVVGSIFNPETKLVNMFHLSPLGKTMSNLGRVCDSIIIQAEELKGNSGAILEGFISGGNAKGLSTSSETTLLDMVLQTFVSISKKVGMDFSVLAGRENGCSSIDIISDAAANAHYINYFTDRPPTGYSGDKKNIPRFEGIDDAECLYRAYARLKLSGHDNIFLGDKDVTAEFCQLLV